MALTLRPAWLNRDLTLLFTARGLRSLTQGYLAVIVPLYLALLGYNAIQLGLLFTASSFAGALIAGAVGFLADTYGRRNLLILLALMVSAGAVVFALTGTFWVLLVAAALSTLGRGGGAGTGGAWGPYYAAEQALIAEHVDDQHRTSAFGAISFVGVLTGAIGSLIAVIPDLLHTTVQVSVIFGDRLIFGLTVLFGILMAVVVIPVQETRRDAPPVKSVEKSARVPLSSDTWNLILKFMATNASNGLALGFLGPITVYWFYRRYGVGASELGALFFIVNIAAAPTYLYAAEFARKVGAVNTIVFTRLASVFFLALIPLMPTYWLASVFFVLRMVFNTLAIPVRQSYLMGIVRREERATAAGISNLPTQITGSLGPTIGGYMMQSVSLDLPIELAAAFQFINALLYYAFFRGIKPPEEQGARAPKAPGAEQTADLPAGQTDASRP